MYLFPETLPPDGETFVTHHILTHILLTPTTFHLYTRIMKPIDIPIIYQDHHLLIVNKPAGLVIHPTYKNANGTMWDALLAYLEQQGQDD
ncbi:MAG TPA: hypothetical protein VKP04_00940, partial [Ktedonobacteraceae bacterium]|nr:hypothetical protein [Ktedonobacteraceae bacterium]